MLKKISLQPVKSLTEKDRGGEMNEITRESVQSDLKAVYEIVKNEYTKFMLDDQHIGSACLRAVDTFADCLEIKFKMKIKGRE